MKTLARSYPVWVLAAIAGLSLCSFLGPAALKVRFPYKQAGLSERQAAAHLLNRFSYGATPGQIDQVVKAGLENWVNQQLDGDLNDATLNQKLKPYDAISMSNQEVAKTFPRAGQLLRLAAQKGLLSKDSAKSLEKPEYRQELMKVMEKEGMRPQQELFRQFFNQKILRATYTNNQMREIMTDFWFNHFNVSLTKNDCSVFIPAYERDVIRPNVFGKFETLLTQTAKSPAMLFYLDNFNSSGPAKADPRQEQLRQRLMMQAQASGVMADSANSQVLKQLAQARKSQGLNENYAREVMELHTLGVDGGYTQSDVTQAAKILTGWTINPGTVGQGGQALMTRVAPRGKQLMERQGFVQEGDFLFAANKHDNSEKIVLGRKFPANGGYQEGVDLLDLLAHHPSTAKFISTKLAVRFVSDTPPASLVDKMARTFSEKDGDIREVLLTMIASPEFWSEKSLREKTKSPFELAISSIRALNAEVSQPNQVYNWVTRMGQRMYYYQAPTGFPDKGQYWINTGSLLNRMNFGLAIASQRVPGLTFNLASLNNNHEPESPEEALKIYSRIFLPERPVDETIKRLTPLLNDRDLEKKISAAADKNQPAGQPEMQIEPNGMDMTGQAGANRNTRPLAPRQRIPDVQYAKGNNSMLAQVVGIIIGSPEFQRK